MLGWTSLYTRAMPNIARMSAPSTRPRRWDCDSVCRRLIQTSAAAPIAKSTSTVKCDGPKAENSRVVAIGAESAAISSLVIISCPFRSFSGGCIGQAGLIHRRLAPLRRIGADPLSERRDAVADYHRVGASAHRCRARQAE